MCQTANERERANRFLTADKQNNWTNREQRRNLNLWMCSGLMPRPIDRLCSHYIESEQSVKGERRGVGSPGRCLLTLLNAAGSMLRSPIPLTLWTLAGWILFRLRLSVDLPEGLDNETVILKLGHPILFSVNIQLFRTHVQSAHFKD